MMRSCRKWAPASARPMLPIETTLLMPPSCASKAIFHRPSDLTLFPSMTWTQNPLRQYGVFSSLLVTEPVSRGQLDRC
jgi:hypothetical protein